MILKVLKTAIDQWFRHRSGRLGAALAYYSVFSMGPLLLIVTGVAGLFFGAEAARKWGLVDTAGQVMVEPQYDAPVYFLGALRGVAWAKRGERWCAIDRRGIAVLSLPCADADPTGLTGHSLFQCNVEH
jgi:WG containing repeat